MDCESQLQLQQQYRITEFGRSAEFPRIPWNSADTWKFRGNGQIPRLGSKFRGPRKTVVPSNDQLKYFSMFAGMKLQRTKLIHRPSPTKSTATLGVAAGFDIVVVQNR